MCSEVPKEFEKTSQVLPFTKYGISTIEEFKKSEQELQHLEFLKKIGLTSEEIKLYQENEAGVSDSRKKIESNILKRKLDAVYNKINEYKNNDDRSLQQDEIPNTSKEMSTNKINQRSLPFYPKGHPIHDLKTLDESLFEHLTSDNTIPITKRRKILRRLERKKERLLAQQKSLPLEAVAGPSKTASGSLWDVKKIPEKGIKNVIGPKKQTMYTIKDNKIVRLEPVADNDEEFRAVDIVVPVNAAEEQLLEGTKMCLDDIKKIERFKDYEPGIPSKVLYLKNIAPSVAQEQLAIMFNQFHLENGGPVELRLLTGRMHGQAFVTFQSENLAIQALDEINGTIMGGRPIIAQFGRNSNRIQIEENR